MQNDLAVLTIILMIGMVLTRVAMMKKRGIAVLHFGKLDKTDFLIPPFCPFLFLPRVCRCIPSPNSKHAGILPV